MENMENIELLQYDLMTAVENGLVWGNQKKNQKKIFFSNKIFKLMKHF